MKITDPSIIAQQQEITLRKSQEKATTPFDQILKRSLDNKASETQSKTSASAVFRSQMIDPTFGLNPVSSVTSSTGNQALDEAESALDLVQSYQEKLQDPSATLNDISPLVQAMDKEADNLTAMMSTMGEGDEAKSVVNDVAVLMKVEAMKFNRGDYL